MILLWLADHEEAAILSAVYNRSCRMCLKKTDKNGNIMLRNKDQAVCDVYLMEFIYHQPSFKGIAGQMAKNRQQHIVEVKN